MVDYNKTDNSKKEYTRYMLVDADKFDIRIKSLNFSFDLITSNHNIEHCNDPQSTFNAIFERLAPGGLMFIATPSVSSLKFPSRVGCLNFYDDDTHKYPVDLSELFKDHSDNITILFYSKSYRPIFWSLIGWALEYLSQRSRRVMLGTWDYYGFEQVMWLKKISNI